ncbi:MAG: ATP-dependent protease, partial [Candidatus Calescibacterium sp.]|nr:AAA family ATPase [Candidatus Calescibacterium sp.]MDW8195961.1 ATP-dependent protease [Candidatus Calescibacterium sp.]
MNLSKKNVKLKNTLYSESFIKKVVDSYYSKKNDVKFVGQDRAVETLKFVVSIKKEKYNVYAAGSFGLGKRTIIEQILADIAKSKSAPDDWLYIYNFDNPDEPLCVRLPNSLGKI